jgi:hypothetical protein
VQRLRRNRPAAAAAGSLQLRFAAFRHFRLAKLDDMRISGTSRAVARYTFVLKPTWKFFYIPLGLIKLFCQPTLFCHRPLRI